MREIYPSIINPGIYISTLPTNSQLTGFGICINHGKESAKSMFYMFGYSKSA
jgi:hypothetical protein